MWNNMNGHDKVNVDKYTVKKKKPKKKKKVKNEDVKAYNLIHVNKWI